MGLFFFGGLISKQPDHCRQAKCRNRQFPRADSRTLASARANGGAYHEALQADNYRTRPGDYRKALQELSQSLILALQPNSYMDAIRHGHTSAAVAYHVKRARDYIHAHAHEKVMLADLTNVAGCGGRALQEAFKNAFGMSPMAYLKSVRLKRVRAELINAEPDARIASIANKWGFMHMGHFANDYAKQFGVLPSETLRYKT